MGFWGSGSESSGFLTEGKFLLGWVTEIVSGRHVQWS
jgi:hypothetical protein